MLMENMGKKEDLNKGLLLKIPELQGNSLGVECERWGKRTSLLDVVMHVSM